MGMRLAGKVAVITGAGRGIGRAEALAFAAEGASVVVNDVVSAEDTVAAIQATGGKAVADTHSASIWANAEAIVAKALEAFGRIDILSNNAGLVAPHPIQAMSEEAWDTVVNVSLKGYAAMIRFAAPHFIAQRSGAIVSKGSTSGHGHNGMANYSAAKEGALGLTRAVARDLGQYGVRCNLIRPINFHTTMAGPDVMRTFDESKRLAIPTTGFVHMPPHTLALPEHVAALTVMLCLPATAHVSGQDFFIMGDQVARFPEPEMIRVDVHPGGWTLQALEEPDALENLFGGIRNRFVKSS